MSQTSIPVPDGGLGLKQNCSWCGHKATKEFEVEKPIWSPGKNGAPKKLKKRAITAPACDRCYFRLSNQPDA